jgi:hypothetical protein
VAGGQENSSRKTQEWGGRLAGCMAGHAQQHRSLANILQVWLSFGEGGWR